MYCHILCVRVIPTLESTDSWYKTPTYLFSIYTYYGKRSLYGGCILNCFMWSSLPCFYTFCRSAIPTSYYILNVFYYLYIYIYIYIYIVRLMEFSTSIIRACTLRTIRTTTYIRMYEHTYTSSTMSRHSGAKAKNHDNVQNPNTKQSTALKGIGISQHTSETDWMPYHVGGLWWSDNSEITFQPCKSSSLHYATCGGLLHSAILLSWLCWISS